jgi:hypothetical protein
MLLLMNEHNLCTFLIYVEKQFCLFLMAHKLSIKDTKYVNKALGVYQSNLVY